MLWIYPSSGGGVDAVVASAGDAASTKDIGDVSIICVKEGNPSAAVKESSRKAFKGCGVLEVLPGDRSSRCIL